MPADSKIKFLITGGSGFVGYNMCVFLKDRYETHATYHSHPVEIKGCSLSNLDITDRTQVSETISRVYPSIIIHSSALSSLDECEKNRSTALAINVNGTKNLVEAAVRQKCRLVYISSDMVFDGERGNYSELDIPRPVNFYGETKLEGEKICLKEPATCIIVRITLQYGWGNGISSSFSGQMVNNLESGKESHLFTDQYRSPTNVLDTSRGLEIAALNGNPGDIYHLSGPDRIDRYSFGLALASIFNLPANLLKKSKMNKAKTIAPRPKDVSFNGEIFLNRFKYQPRGVYEGIKAMAHERH
jgi:dTDP-4-dehydrorhamnose reductase